MEKAGDLCAAATTVGGTSILADAARGITSDQFDPSWWERGNRLVGHATGRGPVSFVQADTEVWVLRHYRRGGWAARLSADQYLWTGFENTRPWREWKLTAELFRQGLPVPQPIAARVVRSGMFYRGDLITRRIEPAQTLADVLMAEPLTLHGWRQVGAMLRRFHDAGVRHDDINARNVLRGAGGEFHLIDFDKAAIVPRGGWMSANLERFRRSLKKFKTRAPEFSFSDADWAALLAGYGTARA